MTRKRTPAKGRRPRRTRLRATPVENREGLTELAGEGAGYAPRGAVLSGGDLDADWGRADSAGDEAVGGSVATPDQDVVDEIGRALGVEQAPDAPVRTSDEILRDRDRFRWHLEREAASVEEAREKRRRTRPGP